MSNKLWKKVDQVQYHENLKIPESWNSLEEFTDWFIDSRFPIIIPWDAVVRRTDDATTTCIFRKNRFQVELYLIYEGFFVQQHEHPGVEVITMQMGGGRRGEKNALGSSTIAGLLSSKLKDGELHGTHKVTSLSQGFCLLSFEKWSENVKMTSAAICWKGKTAGPIHDKLIEQHYPGAVINPGYADVTQSPKYKNPKEIICTK